LRKKSCIDEWIQKNIENQKFTQLPNQISNGPPLTTYILGGQFCIFLCYLHKTPTFVLFFHTFSYFIPTFPKILVLLLSYSSTQGCQKACEIMLRTKSSQNCYVNFVHDLATLPALRECSLVMGFFFGGGGESIGGEVWCLFLGVW
jgi:hypothetical protein